MTTLSITDARKNLYKLVDATFESHDPIFIKGKRHNAVLISEEDWLAVQETLHLVSIPGMKESIQKGLKEAIDDCSEELTW